MTSTARILRYVAFTLTALYGLLGGLFVAGSAFDDPGGWAAVGLTALWVLPLVAMSGFAVLHPEPAGRVLVVVTVLVLLFVVADSTLHLVPREGRGPVAAVSVFTLGVALAFLGLHRARLAGLLMMALAVTQLLAIALGFAIRAPGAGPGPGAMLGGSSGVVVVPTLLAGALFWLAGSLAHETQGPVSRRGGRPR